MNRDLNRRFGVLLQYIQMSLAVLISFIYTPIMLNKLGTSEYGIYNIASSIISYLSLLSLGFGGSYLRFFSRYKETNNEETIAKLNGTYMEVFFLVGVVSLVCGFILSSNVSFFFNETYSVTDLEKARVIMVLLSINIAISFPMSIF